MSTEITRINSLRLKSAALTLVEALVVVLVLAALFLSNELTTPVILVCPLNRRKAVTNFAVLNDEHLSELDANCANYRQWIRSRKMRANSRNSRLLLRVPSRAL